MGRVVTGSKKRLKLLNHDSDSNSCSSSKKKRCKVIPEILLPQDVMVHILTFVSVKCLVNSARYVCKPWAATIRTSQFAQAWQLHSKPGLYVQNSRNSYFLDIKDCVDGRFEFERTDLETPLEMEGMEGMGRVIASCNGILLLLRHCIWRPKETQVFLANPITKCWIRTPPLPFSHDRRIFSVQLALVCVPHAAKFKLFFIDDYLEVSGAFYYVIYVLTIGIDNSWREIYRKKVSRMGQFWKPLYNGGNYLYWINVKKRIIVLDVDKETIVGKFSIPRIMRYSEMQSQVSFLWMGNQISCIVRSKDLGDNEKFQIYLLDFDSGKWSLYHEMGPFDFVVACGHKFSFSFPSLEFCYWIHDQIILRVTRSIMRKGNCPTPSRRYITMHFSYSVKTRKVTKIEGIAMGDHKVWLHTNSLISLPSTPT